MQSHIRLRLRVPSNALAPLSLSHQSQAQFRTIAREGIQFTTRRSLSESVRQSFVVRQHHWQCSRPRSYSITSRSTPALEASSPEGPQGQSQLEDELYSDPETTEAINPDMLALKPDLQETGGLPPLPPIQNDALRQQVFTHRSVYARSRHDFEDSPQDPAPDYEVLEFHGDAVLGLIITDLVRDCYSNLRVGPATKIRSLVVGNATLADISVKYGLPQHLRVHHAQAMTLVSSIHNQADLFEAYIGGLYRDQGLDVVRKWVNVLFLPYVKEAYRVCRDQHGLPSPPPSPSLPHAQDTQHVGSTPSSFEANQNLGSALQNGSGGGHLSLFNQYLQQKHMSVEWKFKAIDDEGTKVTPIWAVSAIVDKRVLAVGRASTKKGAQSEAAREGLIQLGVSSPVD